MTPPDPLADLAWLVDAGADEAVLDAPVDRFVAKAQINPPLEGGGRDSDRPSKREAFRGGVVQRAPSVDPSPKFAAQISSLAQGEGKKTAEAANTSDPIGAAMETAARANSLAELKAALESFDGSPLKKGATNTVFADGIPDFGIMFIGEAPGRDEDRQGLPFVGRAGQLLDRMMAAIHLSRKANAYITNVANWRPPDNREPTPEEAAINLPFLRRHVELVNPQIIILLGATPRAM